MGKRSNPSRHSDKRRSNERPRRGKATPQGFSTKRQDRQKPSALPSSSTFEATYLGVPEGIGGFLRPLGMRKSDADLLVDWHDNHRAIHGDTVMAEVTGTTLDGRPKARIAKILSRNPHPIPAHLQKQSWGWQAVPLEPRMQQMITVQATELAQDGDLVSVKLESQPDAPQLRGTVVARLGRPTDLKIENTLTAALFHLRTHFPDAVMEELAPFPTTLPQAWLQGREDLRDTLTVTVDPPTAKDFDDAISLEVLPDNEGGGWLLAVHIADVSHYVKPNGPLDQEARLRGTSVYFPDQCIPMLPERLSSELCSLQEGVDRLTLTAWMTLSPDLMVVDTRFSQSVIRSRKRLTYDEVKLASLDLDKRKRAELGEDICQLLDESLVLSRKLTAQRLDRGAMNLENDETEFVFSDEGLPVDARKYGHHDAHRMIEAFMLLANEAVATFFTRHEIPTIYRIHDEPDPLKLQVFAGIATTLGLLPPHIAPTPDVLNGLLDKIHGSPLEAMLNTMLLRSLKRAEYSVDNIGHSGLALDDYLHFTSPIRRYPDLIVHRYLKKQLENEPLPPGLKSELAIIAKQATDTEQTATEAERENDKWKTCLLMKSKVGQKFEGRIQGFSLKVAFVRLESPFVEVGVPLGALGGHFVLDEHRTRATGMGGQVVLQIGDTVKVEIIGVDEDLRRVSAWLLEAQASDKQGKRMTFAPSLTAPTTPRESDFVTVDAERPSRRPREREGQGRGQDRGEGRGPARGPGRPQGRGQGRTERGTDRPATGRDGRPNSRPARDRSEDRNARGDQNRPGGRPRPTSGPLDGPPDRRRNGKPKGERPKAKVIPSGKRRKPL